MIQYPSRQFPTNLQVLNLYDETLGIGGITNTIVSPSSIASNTWPAANRAIAYPITVPFTLTAVKLYIANGGTATGNLDIGIYDVNFSLKIAIGSTAQSGTNTLQLFDITDTVLTRGIYFLAIASSSAASTMIALTSGLSNQRAAGIVQMASAMPLPATLTPAAMATAFIPIAGIAFRVTL